MRRSRTARKRSALLANREYTAPLEKPAASAIRSSDAAAYPSEENASNAASRSAERFASDCSGRLRRVVVGTIR
jgi:hypothetical protein